MARRIATLFISHQPCVVLLTPMADGQLFLAGESAAASLKLPTILWVLDDWFGGAGKELTWVGHKMNEALRRCAARSIARFAVSREMAERYEKELGGKWEVLCNGVEPRNLTDPTSPQRRPYTRFRIGFFGAVYSVQADLIIVLCGICQKLDMELIVYGDVDPNLKPRLNRFNCLTFCKPVSEDIAGAEMKKCDALYLPYSFDPSAARVVETSFPTKIADYIVSGKPVIINGPPNSTIIKFSRRTGWGIPVDEQGAGALLAALSSLRKEYPQHIRKLSESSARAAEEINLPRMRARFQEAVSDAFRRQSAAVT